MFTQARHIYRKLGGGDERAGRQRISSKLPITDKQLRCYTYEREKGGTDGLIPARWQQELQQVFPKELDPSDFFVDRESDNASVELSPVRDGFAEVHASCGLLK